jgi:hypothetical protein
MDRLKYMAFNLFYYIENNQKINVEVIKENTYESKKSQIFKIEIQIQYNSGNSLSDFTTQIGIQL